MLAPLPTALRVLAALLLTASALLGAPAAAAHTVLTSSDPAGDSTLNTGPLRVSATFNEELQNTFAAMTVVGPDGNLWSAGDPDVTGRTVGVAVRPLGPSGRYTVNYRVTSADGHVVSGSWSFTVSVPSTGAPGPAAAGDPRGDPIPERVPERVPERIPERIPLWPFVVGALTLAGGAAAWGLRRRS